MRAEKATRLLHGLPPLTTPHSGWHELRRSRGRDIGLRDLMDTAPWYSNALHTRSNGRTKDGDVLMIFTDCATASTMAISLTFPKQVETTIADAQALLEDVVRAFPKAKPQ